MAIIINKRSAVHKGSSGVLTTQDVCLTTDKKIPVTYSNIAKSADAANTAQTVFINGNPVCNQDSIFSKSTGDEPGDQKGRESGTIQAKAEFISGSANVFIEGVAAVRQGEMMVSNNRNTSSAQLQQPGFPSPKEIQQLKQQQRKPADRPDQINIDVVGIDVPLLEGGLYVQ